MKVNLVRSHYEKMVIGACNSESIIPVGGCSDYNHNIKVLDDWSTKFDGGQYKHYRIGQDRISIYLERFEDGNIVAYATRFKGDCKYNFSINDSHQLWKREFRDHEIDGFEINTNQHGEKWVEEIEQEDPKWEKLDYGNIGTEVPYYVIQVLEKTDEALLNLFGQGGSFFEV